MLFICSYSKVLALSTFRSWNLFREPVVEMRGLSCTTFLRSTRCAPNAFEYNMPVLKYIFTPNHERHEGVRPIQIYLLRMFYFLMVAFVATDSWKTIISHEGPWDRFRAMSLCVWAAYSTLGVFGLIHPLKLLPILIFMIFYKSLWLVVVALPLWRAGELANSPAAEMAGVFMMVPLAMIAVPWIYAFKTYVLWPKKMN